MAKFVLIDSNIAGDGGHYLEYAEQILEIAGKRGFDCHLAANKAFEGGGASGINYTTHSIFSYDMWGRNLSRRRRIPNEFTVEDRRYLRDYYSVGGLLWNASSALSTSRHYSQQTSLPSPMARRLHQVHVIRTRVEALQGCGFHDSPELAVSEAEDRALRYRGFRKALEEASRRRVVTTPESLMLANMLRHSRASDSYATGIARLLDELEVGLDDHIFVPTLSLAEARSLRDLLRREQRARQPHWSLLFRRDVYDGYSADWPQQDWAAHEARNLFASFQPLMQSVRISFFTDTDPLTKQYNRLGSVPFRTTAIPVRTTKRALAPQGEDLPWKLLVLCSPSSDASVSMFLKFVESLTRQELEKVHLLVSADFFAGAGESRASARARLRPYIGDAVTIANPTLHVKELLAHADGCVVIEPESLASSVFGDCLSQLQNMPVLAPTKSNFARALKGRSAAQLFEYPLGRDTVGNIIEALRWLLAEPRTPRAAADRLVIGYLGDARAEKGFHLLPDIVEALTQGGENCQSFLLEAQVYHPTPESDIRMLRAMERVRQMPPDRVNKHEGALISAEYQAIIARSDVIFNVYARHNYVSRSSGIFVEALASLKPVLTTSGTWMSALMGEWSQPYHDYALHLSMISEKMFSDIGDWNFLGKLDFAQTSAHQTLDLKPGISACSTQPIPERANHVRVEVCTASENPDAPLYLIVAWQDQGQLTFLELERQLNRTSRGVISSVFPVPAGARFLWIGLSLSCYLKSCTIEWVRVSWHATSGHVAEMPGGIVVTTGDDAKLVRNSIAALRTLQRAYPAYVDSCSWVFDKWCKEQNAVSLFNDLTAGPPAQSRSRRFVGREW